MNARSRNARRASFEPRPALIALVVIAASLSDSRACADSRPEKAAAFDFALDIVPLLHRQGCSSAYCHGSASGRGGFKLSLFGTDPAADYGAIVDDLDGRRLDFLQPGDSLVLAKPSRELSHGGGKALPNDGGAYTAIRQWIEDGAPLSRGGQSELVGLRLDRREDGGFKAIARLKGEKEIVERDVTRLAVFSSSNEQVAGVDNDGVVTFEGRGEAWIFARYCQLSARASVIAPIDAGIATTGAVGRSKGNELDRAWRSRLQKLGLAAGERAPDSTIVRRLYLDLAGRPPTPSQARRFISKSRRANSLDERRALVESTARRLLEDAAFDGILAEWLAEWLELPTRGAERDFESGRNERLRTLLLDATTRRRSLTQIAESALRDESSRELVDRFGDPRDRAEFVGRAFLGMRLGCARCHNHPLDRWTQDEHLSFSALFAPPRPGPGGQMMAGKLFRPRTGEEVAPKLLSLVNFDAESSGDHQRDSKAASRRALLAQFVVDKEHAQLERTFANRVFAKLLGRGLVEPLDDHRLSNPAVHEPVLDALTGRLAKKKGDLRDLVAWIVSSDLYATSSIPTIDDPESVAATNALRFFAHRESKSLTPLRLERAVRAVIGTRRPPATFAGPSLSDAPLARQLDLLNGPVLQRELDNEASQVDAIFVLGGSAEEQLEELYLLVLSRLPRANERRALLPLLEAADELERAPVGRDLAFALLASREFSTLR